MPIACPRVAARPVRTARADSGDLTVTLESGEPIDVAVSSSHSSSSES
jgi:hypothetical protein